MDTATAKAITRALKGVMNEVGRMLDREMQPYRRRANTLTLADKRSVTRIRNSHHRLKKLYDAIDRL